MTAWKVFWVDVEYWTSVAAEQGSDVAAVRLGESVQRTLDDVSPMTCTGVGALTIAVGDGEEMAVRAVELDSFPPSLLMWSRGSLTLVRQDGIAVPDLMDASPAGHCIRPALLLSASADEVHGVTAAELGAVVYRLIATPTVPELSAGNLQVLRGPEVDIAGECWIVWLDSLLRDPAALSPSEAVRFQWRPSGGTAPAPEAELSLAGFLLEGGSFEDTFLPAGPGQLSVLFGRNGAGKSLALTSVEQALRACHRGALKREPGSIRPWCTLLLKADSQAQAPRLFAQVLAHLGWGPDTVLPPAAQVSCQRKIPAWNSGTARPAGAPGLTVDELGELPLDQLRETVIEAVIASMPHSTATRVLAEAIFSSPVLALSPDWRVGLAFIPGKPNPALEEAASEYLAVLRASAPEAVADDLHQAILPWIWQLAGERPSAPVVLATANLAHAGEWFGVNDPGSGWPKLGQALAGRVLCSVPLPVFFAPGQTTLQPGDAAAEEAILSLLEHLLESAEDTGPADLAHPIPRYIRHAHRLAELIEREANQLVPRFAADAGSIKIRVANPLEWHARRATATFTGGIGGEVAIDSLPSGLRTWTLAAIGFAAARLKTASWTGADADLEDDFSWNPGDIRAVYSSRAIQPAKRNAFRRSEPSSLKPSIPAAPKVIYLLDEPEAHLHLTAQRDITATAAALADNSCGVLTATHSLHFLDTPSALAKVVTLDASHGKVQPSSWTGLTDLTEHAESLGISPSALAMACRGVLVVEGPHDKEVIRRYGDIDLDKERILIVPLQGIEGAAGIAELEFLHSLRIPIHVLPDHVRADAIRDIADGKARGGLTKEEQELKGLHEALRKLHSSLKQRRVQVNVLAFPHIDIIRAVPEQEINWALRQLGRPPFSGWKPLDEHARAERKRSGQKFKETFRQDTGADVGQVLNRLIRGDRHGPRSPELHGLLSQLLAYDPDKNPSPGITSAE